MMLQAEQSKSSSSIDGEAEWLSEFLTYRALRTDGVLAISRCEEASKKTRPTAIKVKKLKSKLKKLNKT